jgi:hypothetical protein
VHKGVLLCTQGNHHTALRQILLAEKAVAKTFLSYNRVRSTFVPFSQDESLHVHCKKRFSFFPSPSGMSLTKLSPAGKREKREPFLQCMAVLFKPCKI